MPRDPEQRSDSKFLVVRGTSQVGTAWEIQNMYRDNAMEGLKFVSFSDGFNEVWAYMYPRE